MRRLSAVLFGILAGSWLYMMRVALDFDILVHYCLPTFGFMALFVAGIYFYGLERSRENDE